MEYMCAEDVEYEIKSLKQNKVSLNIFPKGKFAESAHINSIVNVMNKFDNKSYIGVIIWVDPDREHG